MNIIAESEMTLSNQQLKDFDGSEPFFIEEQALFSNEIVEVKGCGDKGFGLYARRDIRPGELICVMRGKIKDFKTEDAAADTLTSYCIWISSVEGVTRIIEPDIPGVMANHSCEPNANLGYSDELAYLCAKCFIKEGEEICFDYGWDMVPRPQKCLCGSVNCRGYIVGDHDSEKLSKWISANANKRSGGKARANEATSIQATGGNGDGDGS